MSRFTSFPRFISWLAIGSAAALVVVATSAFTLDQVKWLSVGVGAGAAVLSIGSALYYRRHIATVSVDLATLIVSGWMVVSSLIFSLATVNTLSLASSLALAALSVIGITVHELSNERELSQATNQRGELNTHLSAAA